MITEALPRDLQQIKRLLAENQLPVSDLDGAPVVFLISKEEGVLQGCIGLQKAGTCGLLRSLVVKEAFKNTGTGKLLVFELLKKAKQEEIEEVYLLTETAAPYFLKFGFRLVDRSKAPDEVQETEEFATLCQQTAVCMHLKI